MIDGETGQLMHRIAFHAQQGVAARDVGVDQVAQIPELETRELELGPRLYLMVVGDLGHERALENERVGVLVEAIERYALVVWLVGPEIGVPVRGAGPVVEGIVQAL